MSESKLKIVLLPKAEPEDTGDSMLANFGAKSFKNLQKLDIKLSFTYMRYLTCECGVTFYHDEDLQSHFMETGHSIVKRDVCTYQCDYCTKPFDTESCMQQHHLMAHQITFRDKMWMTQQNNYGSEDFKCQICDKQLKSKFTLWAHMKTHMVKKEFKCDYCDRTFTMKNNLKTHINTHTGARPHACDQCPLAFGSYSNLKRHLMIHKGVKPFVCEECPRAFSSNSERTIHYNTVHLKLPFPYKRNPRGTGRPRMTITNYHKFINPQ